MRKINKNKHLKKKVVEFSTMNSLTPEQRMRLETSIEKEVHHYFSRVMEMTSDDVFLFAKRQNLDIPPGLFAALMENVRASFANNKLRHFDSFYTKIKAALDEVENPLNKKK